MFVCSGQGFIDKECTNVDCLRDFCVLNNRLLGKTDDLARASLSTWLSVCYFLTKSGGERNIFAVRKKWRLFCVFQKKLKLSFLSNMSISKDIQNRMPFYLVVKSKPIKIKTEIKIHT